MERRAHLALWGRAARWGRCRTFSLLPCQTSRPPVEETVVIGKGVAESPGGSARAILRHTSSQPPRSPSPVVTRPALAAQIGRAHV